MRPDNITLAKLYDATKPPSEEMVKLIADIVHRLLRSGTLMQFTYDDRLWPAGVNAVLADYANLGDSMDNLFGRIYRTAHAGIAAEFEKQLKENNDRIQGRSTTTE